MLIRKMKNFLGRFLNRLGRKMLTDTLDSTLNNTLNRAVDDVSGRVTGQILPQFEPVNSVLNRVVAMEDELKAQNLDLALRCSRIEQVLAMPITPRISEIYNEVKRLNINYMNVVTTNNAVVLKNGYEELFDLFRVKDVVRDSCEFCRIGNAGDGGYVMLDDFADSSIAYSFGISTDVSWDEAMTHYGMDIYMYDHTIEKLPSEHEKFHFFKTGIKGNHSPEDAQCKTLEELMHLNGHEKAENIILKLDVEGAEWDVLEDIPTSVLDQFKQLVIEFHDLNHVENRKQVLKGLSNLNQTHQVVHVHANNYCTGIVVNGKIMPDVLEVTYLNRRQYKFVESSHTCPTELDLPNNPLCPDIVLEQWDK